VRDCNPATLRLRCKNVGGIGSTTKKRQALFNIIRGNVDIAILSETKFKESDCDTYRQEWNSSLVQLLYIREFHSWRYVSQSDSLNLVSDRIAMSTLPLIMLKSACLFFVVDPMPPTFLHLSLRVAGLQSLTPASLLMVVLLLK
jgi:hypothetical protein